MLRSIWLLLLLFSVGSAIGQPVTIRGRALDYAGKELIFYYYPEPISHLQKKIAETRVGSDGNFTLTFNTNQPIEIYADLEKFRGTVVAEPGANYQISLPAYSPRTIQEAASPYFEPELFWLGIKEVKSSDLNFQVRAFLTDYNKELATRPLDIYQRKSADTVKSIIARLEKNYPAVKDSYLNTLKTCSYGELEFLISQTNKEPIILKYFARNDIYLSHPAYQHLFTSLFSNYLNYKSQDIRQKGFIQQAVRGNFTGFVNQLTTHGFRTDVAELVAVKSFYDGYYSNKFDKKSMLNGLKEAAGQATFNPLKESMPDIINKISSLQEGSPAPNLVLKNQSAATTPLRTKAKFVYLAFFRSDSKACRAELDSLVSIEKKLNQILTIVPVSLDQNFAVASQLWKEKKYPWELNGAADPEKARTDYQIKSLPAFYLISPDQKLLLAPALPPSHNFETLFLKIYREQRFIHKR